MLGFDGEYSACHAKARFWCFLVKNRKKSPVKHFIENHILLNFVNLYTAFRPTIPGRNIPDNSFLIIFNPLPPKLQCWIWQNSPHSTHCFNSEIGGGENHELSGNFCQRLSELKKKKGMRSSKYSEYLNIASWPSCSMKKDVCLPPNVFSAFWKEVWIISVFVAVYSKSK